MPTKTTHCETDCIALCPSCQEYANFSFVGVQKWPDAIVAKTGRPATQTLHVCGNCGTSVTDVVPQAAQNSA